MSNLLAALAANESFKPLFNASFDDKNKFDNKRSLLNLSLFSSRIKKIK